MAKAKKGAVEEAATEDMSIENREISIDLLHAHKRNYNQHSPTQIGKLAESLRKFGQTRSIVVWKNPADDLLYILAGHGITDAARRLNWKKLRADVLLGYSENLALAYLAADNELARQSDPDAAALALIIDEVTQVDPELLYAVGYDADMFQDLLAGITQGIEQDMAQVTSYATPPMSNGTPASAPQVYVPPPAAVLPPNPERERMMATLNAMASGGAKPADGDESGAPPAPTYENPYVQLTFPCDMDQRTVVMTAVNRAKADFGVMTSTQAILRICQLYLEKEGQ